MVDPKKIRLRDRGEVLEEKVLEMSMSLMIREVIILGLFSALAGILCAR